jgi:hypothetical protein
VPQPRVAEERTGLAGKCCATLEIKMPLVVDELDDRVGRVFSGMPDRLYVIDRQGRVAYKSGRGPFGFKPGEMEQALILLLLDEAGTSPARALRFPLLSTAEAWQHLPVAEKGAGQPLPAWARMLAGALPRTTAALLELDYAQRMHSSLDPQLRGRMRWVAARANGSKYGEACAAADLRRAGLGEAEVASLARSEAALPAAHRQALAFARKMMRAADTVTDEEVARLIAHFGDKQVVGMVLLLAYANFQDRLVLHLGVGAEEDGPLPPLAVRFRQEKTATAVAARSAPKTPRGGGPAALLQLADPREWARLDYGQLQERLERQRQRAPRIRVPSWDELRQQGTPERPDRSPLRIRWSLVCQGYQPALAGPWFKCLRTFAEEAAQDRVFEEGLFWVITRRLHCFY